MQCIEVRDKLADYSVGLLSERERRAIQEHLDGCASCRQELRALERVDRLLDAVPLEEPPAHLWQSIRSRIEAQPQPVRPSFWRNWFTLPRLALGGAIAATLLVALAYFTAPHPPSGEEHLQADPSQLMHTHQLMSWGDPLSDKAALGTLFASRPHTQEVP